MKVNVNKLWLAAAGMGIAVSMASCDGLGKSETSYLFVKEESGGLWGMINDQGKTIFSEEFEYYPNYLGKDLMQVSEGSGSVIYTIAAKPKPINDVDDYEYVGCFIDSDIAPAVQKNQRISVINTQGETKFTLMPSKGKEITCSMRGYSEGLLGVMNEDGEWGYVDKNGSLAIKFKYQGVTPFIKGNAIALNQDHRFVIIDKKGEEKVKIKESYGLSSFTEYGILLSSEDGRYSFINAKGEYEKLPASVSSVYDYNDKYIVFRKKDGDVGVMDRSGETVIRPKYRSVSLIDGGKYFLVEHNDKYQLIDKNDDVVTDFEDCKYLRVLNQKSLLFVVKEGSEYAIVDKNGKAIDKKEYYDVGLAELSLSQLAYQLPSCYANITGIINQLSDMISDKGIDGFVPGTLIKESMIVEKKGYYSFYPADHEAQVYGCTFSTYVEGYRYLYNREYYGYGYGYDEVFNSDNRIEYVRIDVRPERAEWSDLRPEIAMMLESKGFTKDSSSDEMMEFSSKKGRVTVCKDGSGFYIKMNEPAAEEAAPVEVEAVEEVPVEEEP